MLPTMFGVNWLLGLREEAKNRFSRWLPWRTSWISDRHDFSYFWSTSHPNAFLASLESVGVLVQVEAKRRFSRWRPSWISNRHDFSYFLSTSHPDASYNVWSQLAFRFRRRSEKIDFQDGFHGGHLGFPIGTILAIFDLQVTPMLPSKFGVNWPFGSGEEAKNRFSRWLPWRPSWISDRSDFTYFWSTSHPDDSYQVNSQLAQGCRRSRLLKQLLTLHDGRRTTDIDWPQ